MISRVLVQKKLQRAAVALGSLAFLAGAPAAGAQSPLEGLTVKPDAVCKAPRLNRDTSIPKPVVESIFPAPGAVVRPGVLVVRITFNVAMSCNGVFLKNPPF